jgi:hypothetical protein
MFDHFSNVPQNVHIIKINVYLLVIIIQLMKYWGNTQHNKCKLQKNSFKKILYIKSYFGAFISFG